MASTNLEQMVKAPQTQQQQHPQQQTVQKCPRCDSTNTKFCYYNNYSLSQPRHFCKACKRYWTRGGTLRNVPVGGGCRKNKRVKRPATITAEDHKYLSTPTTLSTKNSSSNAIINVSPLLTNMHSNLSSFQRFSEYSSTRVGSGNTLVHGFDDTFDHPLGFSSGQLLMANGANTNSQTGLTNSCYASLANNFGPLSTSSGFASLLESDHGAQQKFTSGGNLGSDHNFVEFARHDEDDMQQKVKMEQQMGLVDPNYSMFWSANGVGNYWLDPANICPNSISSLI